MQLKTLAAEPQKTDNQTDTNRLFPVFLKLEELNTLIVGGGAVGLEKISAVLNNSPAANVTLIAPSIKDEIILLAQQYPNVRLFNRVFLSDDLDDKDIVIAATNDKELNRVIKEEAKIKKVLANVADTPGLCDFYLSSVVQKGSIKLAISTNGKSPTIAKRLKEILNNAIPDEMETVLDNLVKIRGRLNGSFSNKVKELNKITSILAENPEQTYKGAEAKKSDSAFIAVYTTVAVIMVSAYLLFPLIPFDFLQDTLAKFYYSTDSNFHWYLLAGFIAQMIDGVLGMAYGVSATTFLLTLGIPPAAASASVHASEVFTSGASGIMHWKFGNVSKKLFKQLLLPGILGAILGAYVLSSLADYDFLIKPVIATYTLTLGVIIILKAVRNKKEKKEIKHITPLAGAGGFLDSVGGGGWGPIVSSTLIAKGKNPLITIGSVNLAEFFVALASSAAFITFLGITHWQIIAGLILGGIIAAPIAAKMAGKLPVRTMMITVGILVVIVSLRIVITMF
ncbi:MAG: TSUP family transporter [Ignavibacteriaceae bacterium]